MRCTFACTYAHSCDIHNEEKSELAEERKWASAVLCGGGPYVYEMSPTIDPSNMDSFVLSHGVVQNARKRLPDMACLVLGKALMWMTTLFC